MQKMIDFANAHTAAHANVPAASITATPAPALAPVATTNEKAPRLHKWEQCEMGQAPFIITHIRENWYSAAPGHCQPGGTCDFCGTGIAYEYHIRSYDGKAFKVGSDCVARIDHDDNRLLTQAERMRAQHDHAKKLAARKARREAEQARRAAALQAERDRNGGQTDAEIAEAKRLADAKQTAENLEPVNGWLLDALAPLVDERVHTFAGSMFEALKARPYYKLSPRQLEVLREIFLKRAGRTNSKAHKAAKALWEEKELAGYEATR